VNLVLEILGKVGIKINELKCIFHAKKVEFLGYIIDSDRIKMDPKKV
jgi:hypothetical protein